MSPTPRNEDNNSSRILACSIERSHSRRTLFCLLCLHFAALSHLAQSSSVHAPAHPGNHQRAPARHKTDYRSYAVVVDAGSTGSRVRVYRWHEDPTTETLPEISEIFTDKVAPGVSDYADNRTGLERHVSELVHKAVQHVPEERREDSSIYFMATAGMRLLLEDNAYEAMEQIKEILSNKNINPLRFESSENARILSGEEEGVFAWIAVNYLSGKFKTRGQKVGDTYGILELGGGSTQIAFYPRVSILADKFPVQVGGVVYPLYVHSYLHYGQQYVDKWIKEQLCPAATCPKHDHDVHNPCMLKGDSADTLMKDKNGLQYTIRFMGSGEPQRCSDLLHKLVYKVTEPWHCFPKPCAIGTSYQPTIQSTKQFFALGAFIHSLKSLNIMAADGRMTPRNTTSAAFEFCSKHIDTLRTPAEKLSMKKSFLSTECLIGLYMPILFTKGYGFSNDTDQIRAQLIIDGKNIEWSLGAVIYENERRACRHCPMPRTGCVMSAADRPSDIGTLHCSILLCVLLNLVLFKLKL